MENEFKNERAISYLNSYKMDITDENIKQAKIWIIENDEFERNHDPADFDYVDEPWEDTPENRKYLERVDNVLKKLLPCKYKDFD